MEFITSDFHLFPEYPMRILWGTPGCHLLSPEETDLLKSDSGGRGPDWGRAWHETWDDGAWHVMMAGWCDPGHQWSVSSPTCDQDWGGGCDIRDSWSVIDDAWHWSVFPSCLKWSASDALINLFSFGWFCLISNGGSLHWEHTVIRIKLDLLTFYTWYVHQHSIHHCLRVSKHQFIKSSCY